MSTERKSGNIITGFISTILSIITAMVGYAIHHSIGWAIADFVFFPLAWAKWLVYHEVNITIIKTTFAFFLK